MLLVSYDIHFRAWSERVYQTFWTQKISGKIVVPPVKDSKTPHTLILRYLALCSIRDICVLSKNEYGVFSTLESSRAQDSRRDEARCFAPSRPRPKVA